MRNYTTKAFVEGNINAADNINQELRNVIEPLNNQLDGHSLPLRSFVEIHLKDTTLYSYNATVGTIGPVNSYYRIDPRQDELEYIATDGDVAQGWNNIEADFKLEFEAREGMLKGSAVICGSKMATDDASLEEGHESSWELSVFANGVLIATSGAIPAGLYTIDLPFSCAVGTEFVTIEPKWRINNARLDLGWEHPNFKIIDRMMWTRNQSR